MIRLFPAISTELLTRVARRAKPRRKGEAPGIAIAKVETILVTLQTRFGQVPEDMEAQVRRSSPELLDDLFKSALTVDSLDLVFAGDSRH
jgi:hypothetical protein